MKNQEENHSEQLTSLEEFSYAETAVLAGISRTLEVIALKPVCENLGISWSWQFEQLKKDDQLSKLFGKEKVVSRDGKSYEMICLPFNVFQDWLWNLNPTDKMNTQLWEEYKKGLVVYLLQMLKVSLDEVQRLRDVEREAKVFRNMMATYLRNESAGKEHYKKGKEYFKENREMKEEIYNMINKDPNQLFLPIQ